MNPKFVAWAIKVHQEHRDVVEYWKKSPDIVEQELSHAVIKVAEKATDNFEHSDKTSGEVARSRGLKV